jgi:hypothetical protein
MIAPHPAPDALAPAVDAAVTLTERCQAMLERLAAKGLAMAEATKEDGAKESADIFAKLSRAVRLTIDRMTKIEQGPRARGGSKTARAEEPAIDPDVDPEDVFAPLKTGKRARVRELVRDVIEREAPDPREADDLGDALDERLMYDDAYDDIESLPLRDIVEHLCADLELKPDWRRWTGEGWIPNPPFCRPLCSGFRTPSRKPILNDLPDDEPDPDPLE